MPPWTDLEHYTTGQSLCNSMALGTGDLRYVAQGWDLQRLPATVVFTVLWCDQWHLKGAGGLTRFSRSHTSAFLWPLHYKGHPVICTYFLLCKSPETNDYFLSCHFGQNCQTLLWWVTQHLGQGHPLAVFWILAVGLWEQNLLVSPCRLCMIYGLLQCFCQVFFVQLQMQPVEMQHIHCHFKVLLVRAYSPTKPIQFPVGGGGPHSLQLLHLLHYTRGMPHPLSWHSWWARWK